MFKSRQINIKFRQISLFPWAACPLSAQSTCHKSPSLPNTFQKLIKIFFKIGTNTFYSLDKYIPLFSRATYLLVGEAHLPQISFSGYISCCTNHKSPRNVKTKHRQGYIFGFSINSPELVLCNFVFVVCFCVGKRQKRWHPPSWNPTQPHRPVQGKIYAFVLADILFPISGTEYLLLLLCWSWRMTAFTRITRARLASSNVALACLYCLA